MNALRNYRARIYAFIDDMQRRALKSRFLSSRITDTILARKCWQEGGMNIESQQRIEQCRSNQPVKMQQCQAAFRRNETRGDLSGEFFPVAGLDPLARNSKAGSTNFRRTGAISDDVKQVARQARKTEGSLKSTATCRKHNTKLGERTRAGHVQSLMQRRYPPGEEDTISLPFKAASTSKRSVSER